MASSQRIKFTAPASFTRYQAISSVDYGASPSWSELSINDAMLFIVIILQKYNRMDGSRNKIIISHPPFFALLYEGLLDITRGCRCLKDLQHCFLLLFAIGALVD